MIIDSQVHSYQRNSSTRPWLGFLQGPEEVTGDDMVEAMDKVGVEKIRSQHGWGLHSGEHYLIRKLGYDVGGRIHLARSSGDLGQVRIHVFLREQILQTLPLMIQVEKILIDFSKLSLFLDIPTLFHIIFPNSCARKNAPFAFIPIVRSQSVSVKVIAEPPWETPALLMRMSMFPIVVMACLVICFAVSLSLSSTTQEA